MSLYLTAILCLLSHGRYRSVWVGVLYTPIVNVPSVSGLMIVSRKGMEPSSFCLLYSKLNRWIYSIDVLEELFLDVFDVATQRYHLHTFSIPWGVQCWCDSPMFKCLHKYVGYDRAYGWPHGCSSGLFIKGTLEHKVECCSSRSPTAQEWYQLAWWFSWKVLHLVPISS